MLLNEIKSVVKNVAKNGCKLNLCLEGHQGIGKTQILKQVADEMGWHYVAVYCAQTSTEDLLGMPTIDKSDPNKPRTLYAVPKLFPQEENTIFVLEEINRAPLEVQQSVLQLLTDKKIGDYELPKNTLICACINPTNSLYMTQELDSVFINRMVKINVETSPEEFIAYAKEQGVEDDILNFISSLNNTEVPIHFTRVPDAKNVGEPIPSPRTWVIADQILKMKPSDKDLLQLLTGAVGKDTASKFIKTRGKTELLISVDQIIKEFDKVATKLKSASDGVLHKAVNDFIDVLNNDEFKRTDDELINMGKFIEYLYNDRKPLASILYQKLDITPTCLVTKISKKYKVNGDKLIVKALIEVGTTIK